MGYVYPPLWLIHACYGHTDGWACPQMTTMTLFAHCGHNGQGLVLVLQETQCSCPAHLLVGRVNTQSSYLHLASVRAAAHWRAGFAPMWATKRPSCRNCDCAGVWSYLPPTYKVGVTLKPGAGFNWACLPVWQGRNCFGGVPTAASRLGEADLQGNTGSHKHIAI